jgi:hypothetical protein
MPCPSCHDADPRRAWERSRQLVVVARLIDESHFSVTLARCPACGQVYASTFSERIDWSRGNDPQDWLVLPLDAAEAQRLSAAPADAVEAALNALPPRRHLLRWFAREATTPEAGWRDGVVWVAPHD